MCVAEGLRKLAMSHQYMTALLNEEADLLAPPNSEPQPSNHASQLMLLEPRLAGTLTLPRACIYDGKVAFKCKDGDFTVFVAAEGFPSTIDILGVNSNPHQREIDVMTGHQAASRDSGTVQSSLELEDEPSRSLSETGHLLVKRSYKVTNRDGTRVNGREGAPQV